MVRKPHSHRLSVLILSGLAAAPAWGQQAPVRLDWLGGAPPPVATGVSWGVPFPRGAIRKNQAFTLRTAAGEPLPLQSWPLAYWPDGSPKWVGFATVAGPETAGPLELVPVRTRPPAVAPGVRVRKTADGYEIDTGALVARIPRRGRFLIESLVVDGREVAREGRLVAILQHGPDGDAGETPPRERFVSRVDSVAVEQSGPVRAVVRIQGFHASESGERAWLPFTVRLHFHAGREPVRLVHSFVYDGDQEKDFIRGLGLAFSVPMREQVHNRHVRFGGEGEGLWAEPVQPLTGRAFLSHEGRNVYPDQVAGRRVPDREAYDARGQALLRHWAVWNDYRLLQPTADGFTVQKRSGEHSAWVDAAAGRRASGFVFVGDVSGGLGVGVKDFWQSYPASLEVRNAAGEAAELRVWLWSPDAPVMDMRHYDVVGHDLLASYEDWQPGFSIAHGVARTSELTLFPSAAVPSHAELSAAARASREPPLLVATPEYLHSVRVFGFWSLPDRSTPGKRWIEERLDDLIAFYRSQIEERRWYGFWNYGDVMHSYDPVRHVWRYDIGGYAWANTELAPDLWLWYSFLRTGRADIFRMAEAMTRHTSEVDVYHLGPFAGLGTRHNVRHWGDGAKEVRVSQATLRRIYYYLTTDERTGDLMREVVDADHALLTVDPLRVAYPVSEHPHPYPTRARFGPDWLAFVGNWMTEWERTGDTRYRDKILTGLRDIARLPYGPFSGWAAAFGYDPRTGHLYYIGGEFEESSHLATIMGGAETMFELESLLGRSRDWDRVWLQYAKLYSAPKEEFAKEYGVEKEEPGDDGPAYARLSAYAYYRLKDPKYAERAWAQLLGPGIGMARQTRTATPILVEGPEVPRPVHEMRFVSTNDAAQWSLNAIQVLELAGDRMPEHHPLWEAATSEAVGGAAGAPRASGQD